jgi:putative endonuclease
MAAIVYILFSASKGTFYTGFTTVTLEERLNRHNSKYYHNKYTARANDWELYFSIECLSEIQARLIESHIKRMKSTKYIQNLKQYPEMAQALLLKYSSI